MSATVSTPSNTRNGSHSPAFGAVNSRQYSRWRSSSARICKMLSPIYGSSISPAASISSSKLPGTAAVSVTAPAASQAESEQAASAPPKRLRNRLSGNTASCQLPPSSTVVRLVLLICVVPFALVCEKGTGGQNAGAPPGFASLFLLRSAGLHIRRMFRPIGFVRRIFGSRRRPADFCRDICGGRDKPRRPVCRMSPQHRRISRSAALRQKKLFLKCEKINDLRSGFIGLYAQ